MGSISLELSDVMGMTNLNNFSIFEMKCFFSFLFNIMKALGLDSCFANFFRTAHFLYYSTFSVLIQIFCITPHFLYYSTFFVLLHIFCITPHFLYYSTFFVLLHIFCITPHFLYYSTFFCITPRKRLWQTLPREIKESQS